VINKGLLLVQEDVQIMMMDMMIIIDPNLLQQVGASEDNHFTFYMLNNLQ
jgi:hypothetical protein